MDSQYLGILRLVRSALTGRKEQLPNDFNLEQVYSLVTKHQIRAMVYEGAVCCGLSKELPVMRQLFHDYCQELVRSEQQMQAVEALRKALDAAGEEYLFFKGAVLKERYPKPEFRVMGDADLLIHTEKFDEVDALLRQQGYALVGETQQEWQYHGNALELEPHKSLVDPVDVRDYEVFGTGWELVTRDEQGRAALYPETELAHLVSHLAKHMRTGGVGLRQMIDLWVLRHGNRQPDARRLEELLTRLGLSEFYRRIQQTLDVWFEDRVENENTRCITQFVFSSGSFGTEQSQVVAVSLRQTGGERVKLHGILSRLFPPRNRLQEEYPILKKRPILLPLVWVRRLISILVFQPGRAHAGYRHMRLTNAETVGQYTTLLNQMGLDVPTCDRKDKN